METEIDGQVADKILAQLGVVVMDVDAELRVLAHSDGRGTLDFQPDDDLPGRPVVDLLPELIGCEPDLEAVAEGRSPHFTLPMINRVGPVHRRYLSLTALPHPDIPGRLILFVQDMTSQGRLDQQLTQRLNEVRLLRAELEAANARLVRLDAEKSGFLRMAAHDLRAPLTVIRGYVQMVRDEAEPPLAEDAAEFLGIALARTEQMARLIDNLLDVEKIESGEVTLRRQPVDLASLVEHVGSGFLPMAQKKGLTLSWEVSPGLPRPRADWDRLVQALNNLVSNALNFTPAHGRVTIDALQQGPEVVVQVTDTGHGISQADQQRLFQRFFRTDDARQQRTAGTGLGLSIVKAVVEQHGGRVFCRSQLGQGSTFGFSLPLEGV